MRFSKEYEQIIESFSFIKTIKKEFYPKNLRLSEDFIKAFKTEYKKLVDEGCHPRKALARINKALMFYI